MTKKKNDTIGDLLEQVRRVCRLRRLSLRTEQTYIKYIRSFIAFHHPRHPAHLGGAEVTAYLTHLAVEGNVAASTQNVAFSALLFLYRNVLESELYLDPGTVRAKRPRHVPVVFSRDEVKVLLSHIAPSHHLMALLLYGCGLRLTECLQLRVKDIDFDYSQIVVRDGITTKLIRCRKRNERNTKLMQRLVTVALETASKCMRLPEYAAPQCS